MHLTVKADIPGSILDVGMAFVPTFLPLLHSSIPFFFLQQPGIIKMPNWKGLPNYRMKTR
jgi:hypothetical protein